MTTASPTAPAAWSLAADLPRVHLSVELFPPKWPAEAPTLLGQIDLLEAVDPAYYTVTSGAGGGGAIDATRSVVEAVREHTGRPVAAHLTCVGRSRAEINAVADAYWQAGIRHIVALRGDAPKGALRYEPRPDGYGYGSDLVAGLKARHPFEISVGCYPETHPEAASATVDLDNLQRKVDAGADRLISQYCFDTEVMLRYRDKLAARGITTPFVPGIMPIHNFPQIRRFSERCGAGVPDWLVRLFDGIEPGSDLHKMVAAAVAGEQCRRLVAEGFEQLHLYALNRGELPLAVFRLLGGPSALRLAA